MEDGAFGSVKFCGLPKPTSNASIVSRALSTPARVRSLLAQALFSASPKTAIADQPPTTPLSSESLG